MIILAIESSCDETAVSIVEAKDNKFEIFADFLASQISVHKKYGGVVPEVAARLHLEKIIPLLDSAFKKSKIKPDQIDCIAVTSGPGLISSLLVGTETAKSLSFAFNKPLLAVNHIESHIYANFLENAADIKFPALALVISGGHTELILMKKINDYQLIGQTRDDAVGEAFDKSAKLLSLPYPGGPHLSQLAEKGNENAVDFPRPMISSPDFDMSFSGLKTAVLYEIQKRKKLAKKDKADIAASFQLAAVDLLLSKTKKAAEKFKVKSILISGGVSANKKLRNAFLKEFENKIPVFMPDVSLCTDNSLMVAVAAYFKLKNEKAAKFHEINANPNWELL